MPLPVRQKLPHEVPSWVADGGFFFITINCDPPNQNHLCHSDVGNAILAAAAFYQDRLTWHCRLLLLMPDHLHAIIAFPSGAGMKTTVTNWKKYLARKKGISWQRDFFDHRLRNRNEETEKLGYILMNPVRKQLCAQPEEWPWIYRPNDRPPPILS